MREIKFEYGFESVNGIVKKKYYLDELPFLSEKCDVWNVLPVTYIRQYSSYKDIWDKEIYKGDILQCENDKIYLVDFRNGSWVIVHSPTCGSEREGECKTDYLYDALKILGLEVIGNEYQNHELLNK